MQKLSKKTATKLFWYASLAIAIYLFIYGWRQHGIFYTGLALMIGILFRYFGNDSLFSELDERIAKKRKGKI
ncbi:hypothetical protein [Enterococcus sp. AZ072]|uniref:hypothetical protein n=1 Tax=unclassified Enterococcus TaxID=2608891 RepID=UPI003D2E3882